MKKLLFLLAMLLLPLGVSAQEFLKIEKVEYDYVCSKKSYWTHIDCRRDHRMIKRVYLSNGDQLYRLGDHLSEGFTWHSSKYYDIKINIMDLPTNYSNDKTFVYHTGKIYWFETIGYKGTLTIKSVKVHEVKRETSASLNGDFSYNGFLALWKGTGGGFGSADGKISGSMRGGTKTVVNLVFDDGTYASIEAADEPIWLDAEAGMKVKLYKLRDTKLYELIL